MSLPSKDLADFLNQKYIQYNRPDFIESDPIIVPHRFSNPRDIELAGFLTATIAWGQRKTIINNAQKLVGWMDNSPYEFIVNHKESDLKPFADFVHRTFNGTDCLYFIHALRHLLSEYESLEKVFIPENGTDFTARDALISFRKRFFQLSHPKRTQKHVSNPEKKASAKRLHMYLRWMVRKDTSGVDFGIWNLLHPNQLLCPLDVHSGNVARKLGLLERKQNDDRAVEELTSALRQFDPEDPVKYDFALFGLGVFEKF